MTTDYTNLLNKLIPNPGGEDKLRIRTAVVSAVNSDGTVDILLSDVLVPDVPALSSAPVPVGANVQVISLRGSLLVIGTVKGAGSAGASDWQAYTPVFTTSGGSANIGSTGIIKGRYRRTGGMIQAIGYMLLSGTGIAVGSGGGFTHSLPVQAATVTDMAWIGSAYFRSSGSSGHYSGISFIDSGASVVNFLEASAHAQVLNTIPFPWGTGHYIRWSVAYEPAT